MITFENFKENQKFTAFNKAKNEFIEKYAKIFWHDRFSEMGWIYELPEKHYILATSISDNLIIDNSRNNKRNLFLYKNTIYINTIKDFDNLEENIVDIIDFAAENYGMVTSSFEDGIKYLYEKNSTGMFPKVCLMGNLKTNKIKDYDSVKMNFVESNAIKDKNCYLFPGEHGGEKFSGILAEGNFNTIIHDNDLFFELSVGFVLTNPEFIVKIIE